MARPHPTPLAVGFSTGLPVGRLGGAVALLVGAHLVGCGAAPPQSQQHALYLDTRKVVAMQESTGWFVERAEVDEAVEELLPSVCRARPEVRLSVIRWLERRIEDKGGSAREAWLRSGRERTAEVNDLLSLERAHATLRAAHVQAEEDCPFWVEPSEDFNAIHGSERRPVIIAESIGGAGLIIRDGRVALGGGGGGRLLFGWGFDARLTVVTGAELGGVAAFPEDEEGTRTVSGTIAGAIPLLARIRDGLSVFDFEVALAARYNQGDVRPPGFRVLAGYGLSTLRVGGFMPHGVLYLGYEYQPPRDNHGAEHSIRIGTRVGLDWDPF